MPVTDELVAFVTSDEPEVVRRARFVATLPASRLNEDHVAPVRDRMRAMHSATELVGR